MTFQIINPESLGAPKGWNNGMLAPAQGRILFVAGQVASDSTGTVVAKGFVEQFEGALGNAVAVVIEAGGQPNHIGRLTIYVTDLDAYTSNLKPLGQAYRTLMGRHFPAMALVQVNGLLEQNAMVEIEATAVIPFDEGDPS
jgi:enamine deaminase RidA (YjgF/YER057c/UK114 family)